MDMQSQSQLMFIAGFACAAHAGQKRKYNGEPYYHHPKRVSEILHANGFTQPSVLAAALLHDVVEDTHVTLEDVRAICNDEIADMVDALTKIDYTAVGIAPPRAERKRVERERLSRASYEVKSIKLADRLDNTPDIIANDPSFAPVFVHETRLLLDEALIGGHVHMWNELDTIVREFMSREFRLTATKE